MVISAEEVLVPIYLREQLKQGGAHPDSMEPRCPDVCDTMHLLKADGMHMPPKVVGAETHPAHIEFEFAQHSIPNQTLVPLYARPQMSCHPGL